MGLESERRAVTEAQEQSKPDAVATRLLGTPVIEWLRTKVPARDTSK